MPDVLGEAVVRIRSDTSGFESNTRSSILGTIGKVGGAAAGLFAGFKVFDFVKDSVIGFNSTLEQSRSAFTNLYGSASKANQTLAELQNFAKTTPFQFEQLIPVSQQLVGALGKSVDLIPIMTQLGDAISATGGSADKLQQLTLAYTQLATSGTAHMGDLNQVNNAVPGSLAKMAQAAGMSMGDFRTAVANGAISSGKAVSLFKKVTTDPKYGIAGGMEAQSKTFAGAVSNIQDALQQGLAAAGKPIFGFVSTVAKGFASFLSIWQADSFRSAVLSTFSGLPAGVFDDFIALLNGIAATAQAVFPILLQTATVAFHGLVAAVQFLTPIITAIFTFIASHTEIFGAIAAGIVIATAAIFGLAAAMVIGTAAATAFGAALAFAFSPITIIVVTIGLLVAALIYLYRNNETARAIMQAAWSAIGSIITTTIAIVRTVITNGAAFILAVWGRIGPTVIALAQNAWNTVMGVIRGVLTVIRGIINVFAGVLTGDWTRVWNGIKQILSGAVGVLRSILSGAIGQMGILAQSIGRAILNGIVNIVEQIPGKVAALIRKIPGAIGDLSGVLVGAGRSLIQGFIDGITGMIGSVKDTLGGIADSAVGWKGPPSYDARVLVNNGQLLMQGFIAGITKELPNVEAALGSVTKLAAATSFAPGSLSGALAASAAPAGPAPSRALPAAQQGAQTTINVDTLVVPTPDPHGVVDAILNAAAEAVR